jgi:hypothetical protein
MIGPEASFEAAAQAAYDAGESVAFGRVRGAWSGDPEVPAAGDTEAWVVLCDSPERGWGWHWMTMAAFESSGMRQTFVAAVSRAEAALRREEDA